MNKIQEIAMRWSDHGLCVLIYRNGQFQPWWPTTASADRLYRAMRNAGMMNNWGQGQFKGNMISVSYRPPTN